MTAFANFVIFWCLSFLGYMAGRRLKVPAPAILGPVACFMVLALSGVHLSVPAFQKPMLSVVTGILLGLRMNHSLKGVYRQIIVYVAWLILLSLAGICILTATGVDRETAFFAAMPGGMAEITLMSLSYRSDPFVTVLLQSSRMLISMTFFSSLAARYRKKDPEERKMDHLRGKGISLPLWCLLIVLSLAGAGIFGLLHIPAATGGLTGASISRESMMGFPHYIIPIILLSLLVTGSGILMAHLLMKLTQWDKITCILSCCPAGLPPTIMVAMEYGADADIVTIFQVLRMVTVLLMTPVLARCLPLFIQMP